MSEKEIVDKITGLLLQIKNEPKNKKKFVDLLEDFLDSIPREDIFWDSQGGDVLAGFKIDLAYYQPNKWIRLTDPPGLFGDDKLIIKVGQLLQHFDNKRDT